MTELAVDRSDLRDQVHAALRVDIIRGRLPAGERLHVGRLADRFGVSPTPVKEALSRLTAEGLVTTGARGGTFVTRPTKASIDEILDLREVLEQYAAARALERVTAADLERLTALCEALRSHVQPEPDDVQSYERFSAVDIAFHQVLIGLAGNARLAQMYDDLHAYTFVARAYHQLNAHDRARDADGRRSVYLEHVAIVDALRDRDATRLRHSISAHLASVRRFGHAAAARVAATSTTLHEGGSA